MENKEPLWYKFTAYIRNYNDNTKNPISRFQTSCCALGQLSLNNGHTLEEIKEIVEIVKKETEFKWTNDNREGGERALFVITTMPYELPLAKNLEALGFNAVNTFNRRNGYPEGYNVMWIISW